MTLVAGSVFAFENDVSISGTFCMEINSIKDNEFEVAEDGVWLLNSEIIATIHLCPDSIICFSIVETDIYNEYIFFQGKGIIENYKDSVKLRLPLGTEFNCNEVFRILVCYGTRGNTKEQRWLEAEPFKVIDHVNNKECIKAYKGGTSISLPDASDDNKGKGKQGIFDLSGRRLSSPPSKGIYIHNGKKVIATGSH
jgi:hypothetical protein